MNNVYNQTGVVEIGGKNRRWSIVQAEPLSYAKIDGIAPTISASLQTMFSLENSGVAIFVDSEGNRHPTLINEIRELLTAIYSVIDKDRKDMLNNKNPLLFIQKGKTSIYKRLRQGE